MFHRLYTVRRSNANQVDVTGINGFQRLHDQERRVCLLRNISFFSLSAAYEQSDEDVDIAEHYNVFALIASAYC